jgi:hypothetical protein
MDFCMKERSAIMPVIGSVSLYFASAHADRTASICCWHDGVQAICEHTPFSVLRYAVVYMAVHSV